MTIRHATMDDLAALANLEAACFLPAEAASERDLRDRLTHYPGHFWLLFDGDRLVSFVDGMVTNAPDLADEMYHRAEVHDEAGGWQMIMGVGTLPAYRGRGCAGRVLRRAIEDARAQGRKGLVLTCKEELLPFYAKFGFVSEGRSASTHGDADWYQMRLTFYPNIHSNL